MISYNYTPHSKRIEGGQEKYYRQGQCLSTDTKPTDLANGSILIEMDTRTIYYFDAENSIWIAFGGE